MRRVLSPSLNPAGIGSAVAAVYAAVTALWNAAHHHGVITAPVLIAGVTAAAFLYTRLKVTPVADPRDGNNAPLLRVADVAAAQRGEPPAGGGNVRITEP